MKANQLLLINILILNLDLQLNLDWASLVAQRVKNLPALQETWVQPLSQEDTLEKGMATHSRILARRISWTEELGRLHSMGSQRVRHDITNTFTFTGQKWIWVFVVLSCSPRFQ